MIRTEREYKAALQKLQQNEESIKKQKEHLISLSLTEGQIEIAMSPITSFYFQLKQEVEAYERIKKRDWDFINRFADFRHVGQLFIALRIAYGLSQKDLADLLGVTEAQVSKDERNEYHGISLERAMRIMEVLRIIPPSFELDKFLNRDKLVKTN